MNRSPLYVGPDEFLTLRGAGGQTFTDCVDSLARADAAVLGIPVDDVVTNIRNNIPDGGVDTLVKRAMPGALGLEQPSVWQYKATGYSSVSANDIVLEMNKDEARARIVAGDVYCLCICDDAPSVWKEERRALMLSTARSINPAAPVPRLFCAGELADWANRFPGVVVRFFRPQLEPVLHFNAWLLKERADLGSYVPIPGRAEATSLIVGHADFTEAKGALLTVSGAMGTGKSRLVAESLAQKAPLVLFIPDQNNAITVATYLINSPNASAILVVDVCTNATRLRLASLLRGSEGRIRAVVVCDSAEQVADFDIQLEPLEDEEFRTVLEANFADLPSTHRRALAHLSDGIPQIAAQLRSAYRRDPERFLDDSTAWAADSLRNLVRDGQDLAVLQLVALLPRVGYRGTVSSQLSTLCRLFELSVKDVIARCLRLARVPGIVVVGPRYIAVRPRLLLGSLLEDAWARWLEGDIGRVLDALGPQLRTGVIKQVAAHGTAAIRNGLVDWAMPWMRSVEPNDLATAAVVEPLIALVEVNPSRVAGRFADLVCAASDETLRASGETVGHFGTRTHVLWTLRDLVARRDAYALAEKALFRLARLEGNPEEAVKIEATATAKWATPFRIFLSGCSVPYSERFARLRARFDEDENNIPHVLGALGLILASHASRSEGRPLHSGRVRPEEWRPATYAELDECLREAIVLLGRCLSVPAHRSAALRVLTRVGRGLLQSNLVESVRGCLLDIPLQDEERVGVLSFARDFIKYDCSKDADPDRLPRTGGVPEQYVARVREWIGELSRSDIGGRLAELIGATHWFDDNPEMLSETQELASALVRDSSFFEGRLSWLTNNNKGNGNALLELGRCIARLDEKAALLQVVFEHAARATNPLFVRGYVLGLAENGAHNDALRERLDALEKDAPMIAADLNRMAPAASDPSARTLRLVREGSISAEAMVHLLVPLRADRLAAAVDAALECGATRDGAAASIGLDLVGNLAWLPNTQMPEDEASLEALWRLMDAAIPGCRNQVQAWGRLLGRLSEREFGRAVELCCRAVMGGNFSMQDEATAALTTFMMRDAALCLSTYGALLLGDTSPFGVGRRSRALRALPADMLRGWIEEHGQRAALLIAPGLAQPIVLADGTPIVDPLTEFVLERFEDDDDVYYAFAHQRHDGSRLYIGDIAVQQEAEARVAAAFLTHRLRRIREWAEEEATSARSEAQWWREHHEERFED